jgi:hypothetical protein
VSKHADDGLTHWHDKVFLVAINNEKGIANKLFCCIKRCKLT